MATYATHGDEAIKTIRDLAEADFDAEETVTPKQAALETWRHNSDAAEALIDQLSMAVSVSQYISAMKDLYDAEYRLGEYAEEEEES